MLLVLVSLLGTADAKGGKVKPYMNGVGATVGTMIFPQEYPVSFPKYAGSDTALNMTSVTGDAFIALSGAMYISKDYRTTINPYYHKSLGNSNAAGFSALGVDFGVDKTLFKERNVMGFGGVNLGAARMKFDQTNKGELNANRLYVQGQVGATYFNRTSAYELALFARLGTTGVESYTPEGGTASTDLSGGVYSFPMIGIKGSYYFGDFRAIHNNNKNKGVKKGKKKGKKKGNGGNK